MQKIDLGLSWFIKKIDIFRFWIHNLLDLKN